MSILCDERSHKIVCSYTKDFEHIINKINDVGFSTMIDYDFCSECYTKAKKALDDICKKKK